MFNRIFLAGPAFSHQQSYSPQQRDFYFEEELPAVTEETSHAVVIIILREKSEVGSTLLNVFERYSADLRQHESRLMLAGINPQVKDQLNRTGMMETIGRENVFLVSENVGESALEALQEAENWIASFHKEENGHDSSE